MESDIENRNCRVEIDGIEPSEWDLLLSEFSDANPYQSWAYGRAHFRGWKLSHLVLRSSGQAVALAQVCLFRLPGLRSGWAYVANGPIWRRKDNHQPNPIMLQAIMAALRDEYADRQGLYLRVTPYLFAGDHAELGSLCAGAGYDHRAGHYRTLLLDLHPTLDELRAGLRPNWRKSLRLAEQSGLELVEGTDIELFDEALAIHREMHARKGYAEFVNMEEFRVMQEHLPDALKMRIVLCRHEGASVSAIGWSVYGDIGIPLIGATRPAALKLGASNLMYWRMVQWFKEYGFRYCDLAGINPERNPGSYIFKSGLAKRHGRVAEALGEFHCCRNPGSRVLYNSVNGAKRTVRAFRLAAERFRGTKAGVARASSANGSDTCAKESANA